MSESRKPDDPDNLFGPTVVFSYGRAEALQDGVLVDLNAVAQEVCEQHFKHPVAASAAVWAIIERAVESKDHCNDYNGVIHDILWMSIRMGRSLDPSTRIFQVIITGAGPTDLHTFKIVCGPGDRGEPVLTIMLPDED